MNLKNCFWCSTLASLADAGEGGTAAAESFDEAREGRKTAAEAGKGGAAAVEHFSEAREGCRGAAAEARAEEREGRVAAAEADFFCLLFAAAAEMGGLGGTEKDGELADGRREGTGAGFLLFSGLTAAQQDRHQPIPRSLPNPAQSGAVHCGVGARARWRLLSFISG